MGVSGPEKAGVGGSTPSLATISLNGLAARPKILHLRFFTCGLPLRERPAVDGAPAGFFHQDGSEMKFPVYLVPTLTMSRVTAM